MAGINEDKLISIVKKAVIGLVIAAGLIFLVLSAKIFSVYVSSPNQYERNFSRLSVPEKSMVNQMKKTGEIQSKMIGPRRATGGNGKFLDEVEKNRRDKTH